MGRKLLFLGLILLTAVALRAVAGLWLVWDYPEPMPASNIVFVVLSSTNLANQSGVQSPGSKVPAGFKVLTNVATPPVAIALKPREFFLCYASNTVTHLVSGFNVTTNGPAR